MRKRKKMTVWGLALLLTASAALVACQMQGEPKPLAQIRAQMDFLPEESKLSSEPLDGDRAFSVADDSVGQELSWVESEECPDTMDPALWDLMQQAGEEERFLVELVEVVVPRVHADRSLYNPASTEEENRYTAISGVFPDWLTYAAPLSEWSSVGGFDEHALDRLKAKGMPVTAEQEAAYNRAMNRLEAKSQLQRAAVFDDLEAFTIAGIDGTLGDLLTERDAYVWYYCPDVHYQFYVSLTASELKAFAAANCFRSGAEGYRIQLASEEVMETVTSHVPSPFRETFGIIRYRDRYQSTSADD